MNEYITINTPIPPFFPYPRFLLKMDISQTAKLLYALLLDRTTLSQKNGWQDNEGRIYIVYPISEITEMLDKGSTTIKGTLNELDAAGLLVRERRGFSAPNRLYVKIPQIPVVQFSDLLTAGKPTLTEPEKRPTDSQKTDPLIAGKPSPNQLTINQRKENQRNRVSGEPPAAFGRYENIYLTETEYEELIQEIPGIDRLIEELSSYIQSEGRQYADHAATLRRWHNREKPKSSIPDYSFKEGESL